MSDPHFWKHIVLTIVRNNLRIVDSFIDEVDRHLKRDLKRLESEADKALLDRVIDETGATGMDLLIDRRDQVEWTQTLTRYFGIILVWTTMEQFLHLLWNWAMHNGHLNNPRLLEFARKGKSPGFDNCLKLLLKNDLGISINAPHRKELAKLKQKRNIIAHAGAWIWPPGSSDGYLKVTDDDLLASKQLIYNVCEYIASKYEEFWRDLEQNKKQGGSTLRPDESGKA
jgi:hypothetical protein